MRVVFARFFHVSRYFQNDTMLSQIEPQDPLLVVPFSQFPKKSLLEKLVIMTLTMQLDTVQCMTTDHHAPTMTPITLFDCFYICQKKFLLEGRYRV